MTMYEPDDRDREIVRERLARLDAQEGPRVGDFVRFRDRLRRISHMWPDGAQTSDAGSWYLGAYGCTFSGSLYLPVPLEALSVTHERREGAVWIFHHDHPGTGRRVTLNSAFRVYRCRLDAPGF